MRSRFLPVPILLACALACAVLAGCGRASKTTRANAPDSMAEAFHFSSAALMHPEATRAVLVTPDGDLFNGEWATRVRVEVDGMAPAAPARIAYEDRWMPVAQWTRRLGAVTWEFEAVALPAPRPALRAATISIRDLVAAQGAVRERRARDAAMRGLPREKLDALVVTASRSQQPREADRENLLVSLKVTVTNGGRLARRVRLAVAHERPNAETDPYLALDATGPAPPLAWAGPAESPGDTTHVTGWSPWPAVGTAIDSSWVLSPGHSRTARFVVPAYAATAGELGAWAARPHEARVEETRRYWTDEMRRGASLRLDDAELERAVLGARVVLLGCRERRDGRWVPLGGPFHYRDIYLRDGARAIQALAVHGYVREARALAASFEEWQWPHGPFVSQKAQLDGTGQALWVFEQTMLRPRPDPSVRRFAESAERAWAWCERQRAPATPEREQAMMRPASNEPLAPGMLPVSNPRDNELVQAQLVGTDAWAIAGYRATARLMRAAGRHADARRVEQSLARYREHFERTLESSGHADVPPSWQGEGIDWGNLAVGYPTMALPASHPRLGALAQRYWAEAGGAGLGFYGTPTMLHGYVGADLGTWALLAGRRAEADSVLDALVAWRSASGGAGELFTRADHDFGRNLPPHATAAAALLALTRNALAFDDADTLMLALGAREAWWQGGAKAYDLPTRWGLLDLELRRRGDVADFRWTPVPVWTALTLPPGTVVRGSPPRPLRPGSRPDVVLAPPGATRAQVRVVTAPRGLAAAN